MILTFYSYKGGVGRSMAMANVADLLARRGLTVLMIDFDLEAPGLEQFFQANVEGTRRHLGLLDLLLGYKRSMSAAGSEQTFRQLENYVCPVYERLPGGGRLDLLPAGQRQDPEQLARYALNLRTFDWQDFYYNWEGELFFEWLRLSLTPKPYDLVLVDSRTGVTEMGGICGYQLADVIIMMCAANRQNVEGTANMVRDFRSANVESLRHGRNLDIVVVPARVEQRDDALLQDFYVRFDTAFADLAPERIKKSGIRLRDLMVPYEPQFAFEERILSDPARAADRMRIGSSFQGLADAIVLLGEPGSRVAAAGGSSAKEPASTSASPSTQYDPAKRFAGYDVLFDCSRSDEELCARMVRSLSDRGLQVFSHIKDFSSGSEHQSLIEETLHHSRVLVFAIGTTGLSEWRQATLGTAFAARDRGSLLAVLPLLLPGADDSMVRGTPLAAMQCLDLREGIDQAATEKLLRAVQSVLNPSPQVEIEVRPPFVGPRPFDEQQADLLFGRMTEVAELVSRLASDPILIVTGPSGCGKTSLVRAGLIPALRQNSAMRWSVAEMHPGDRPLASIAQALVALFPKLSSGSSDAGDREDSPERVEHLIDDVLESNGEGHLLLVVDQFEELFFLQRDEAARTRIADFLVRLLENKRRGRFAIVATMRSDFLDTFSAYPELARILVAHSYLVPAMNSEDIRQAIEGPAERAGLALEPGLAERITAEVRGEPGALPLLQSLLHHLAANRRSGWLTNSAYESLGGVRGLLSKQAEDLYVSLVSGEQEAMRRIMLRLIRVAGDGENTRRRVAMRDLLPAESVGTPGDRETLLAVAKRLVDERLLVASFENGEELIEPAHEALVRYWERLQAWLEEERAFLEWRQRLATQSGQWHAGRGALLSGGALTDAESRLRERGTELNANEAQFILSSAAARDAAFLAREKRRRFVVRGSIAASVVFFGVSLLAVQQWNVADGHRDRAEEALKLAVEQYESAQQQYKTAEQQRAAAEKVIHDLQRNVETLKQFADQASNESKLEAARRAQAEQAAREAQASIRNLQEKADMARKQAEQQRQVLQEQASQIDKSQRSSLRWAIK